MNYTGEIICGYAVQREIARTENAIVFQATHVRTGEPAAAKLLRNDKRGRHEIEMLRRVARYAPSGPAHVVRLLAEHSEDDNLWLIQEYFDSTLESFRPECMTPLLLMSIAIESVKGLVEMDRADVVDDDVKPANIAFKYGSGRVAHIDLGCARLRGEPLVGRTPDFAAPEIECGRTSDTSPCYAWARTIEQVTLGKVGLGPSRILSEYVPWVGRRFSALVARCCRLDPHERPSVVELYRDLKHEVSLRERCRRCKAVKFRDSQCWNCG